MSNNIINIIKLILKDLILDCSVFYIIDKTLEKYNYNDMVRKYHNYILQNYFQIYDEKIKFYDLFYKRSITTTKNKFNKELNKFKSYNDFIKAKKNICYIDLDYDLRPLSINYINKSKKLSLQKPILKPIKRLAGIMYCDYMVNAYFVSYIKVLKYFIPNENNFNDIISESFFKNESISWNGFFNLTQYLDNDILDMYDDLIFTFLKESNKYFYDYFDAFIVDLNNKLIYEPVTFYFAVISLIFSILTFIQVLQQANIIKPINN